MFNQTKESNFHFLKNKLIVLFILPLVLLTGCSNRAELTYNPIFPKTTPRATSLMLYPMQDDRVSKGLIGDHKNAFGMPIVTVYTDTHVSDWASAALSDELTRAGYSLKNENVNYKINGVIKKAYACSYVNYSGKLTVTISVIENNKKIFEKTYDTKLTAGVNILARTKKLAQALEVNLQEICKQFITDLNDLQLTKDN